MKPPNLTRPSVLAVSLLSIATLASCAGDDPDPVTRNVPLVFSDAAAEGHNHVQTIDDGATSHQYGTIVFVGEGTLDGDDVDVELQAFALYRDGSGPSGEYLTLTTGAGDELLLELRSFTTPVGDTVEVRGTLTVVAGTGRYDDVTGGGPALGVRDATFGSAVEWTADLTLTGLDR